MKNKIISLLLSNKIVFHSVTLFKIDATYNFDGVLQEQEIYKVDIILSDGKLATVHHANEAVLYDLVKNLLNL